MNSSRPLTEPLPAMEDINNSEVEQKEKNTRPLSINKNRNKRSRAYRSLERKYNRSRILILILVLVSVAIMAVAYLTVKRYANENINLGNELNQLKFRQESLMNEIQQVRIENDNLVQGRIPGLVPLKFDNPYKMENQMLKSVVFTHTQHNGKTRYEFLAVIHNTTEDVIRPASSLIFFNQLGVEVGKAKVAVTEGLGTDVHIVALQPGESHSLSGSINMSSNDRPHFFKLIRQGN